MLLAALALAIPLPALALEGEPELSVEETPAPATLSVSTGLGGCGVTGSQVYCTLRVSFSTIEGASEYTAAVTRADGSVVDYGSIPAGGGALYVPYVGRGSYSVRISAYGAPPVDEDPGNEEDGRGELIVSDATETPTDDAEAEPTGNADVAAEPGQTGGDETRTPNASATDDPGADGEPTEEATPETPPCEPTPPPPPPAPEPLPEPPPPDTDPEKPDEDADGIADADERYAYEVAVREQQAAQAAAESQLPEAIECPPAP